MKIVVGNWKMDPEKISDAEKIFKGIVKEVSKTKGVEIVVCPPFLYTQHLISKTKSKKVSFGAQDVSESQKGSHTGEISAEQLANLKVKYVIVGHSERRALGETNEIVSRKINSALQSGLNIVLCVGEAERNGQEGDHLEFIKKELLDSLAGVDKRDLKKIVIAYEPIWAIGKSEEEAMKGEDLHIMNLFIKKVLSEKYGKDAGMKVRVIYGGSVTPANVEDLITKGHVDGVLPGRASRDPKAFGEIVKKVSEIK